MPADMTLAEILDEAERLEKLYAVAETACYLDVVTADFYATHGPRLVAALRAAVEMRESFGAEASVAAFDAIASGGEPRP